MLDLVDGPLGFRRDLLQADPDQDGAPDVIAHDARLSALATFQARELFRLTMKLLNFPAPATHLLCSRRVGLSLVVGYDVVRALGGQHNPEQFHFIGFGKIFDFDDFAVGRFIRRPLQAIEPLIGPLSRRVIDLPVVLQWTIEHFVQLVDIHHQIFSGIPGVHQHGPESQLLVIDDLRQHLAHMDQFALAIASRIIDPIIDDPELAGGGIDVHTGDHADAFNQPMGVATVLTPHQFDVLREVLIDDRVIEDQITVVHLRDVGLHVFPDQPRGDLVARQIAINRVVAEFDTVIGKVRQGVVNLATQQVLTVIQAGD